MATHLRGDGTAILSPAESKIVDTEIQNLIDTFGVRFSGRDSAFLLACERMGDQSAEAYNARADEMTEETPAGQALPDVDPDFGRGEDE